MILAISILPVMQAQNPAYPQGEVGQRSMVIENQCQNALVDRVSADAGRRIVVQLDSKNFYPVSSTQQGLRGQLRYMSGPTGSGWRSATYDCVFNVRNNRVERATYSPRAGNGGNWPEPGPGPRPRARPDSGTGRG